VLVVLVALAGYLWYAWPEFAPVETLPLEETPAIVKAREDGPVVWEWLAHDNISPALRRSVVEELDPDFFDPAIGTPEGNKALQQAARKARLGEMPKRIVGLSPISRAAVRWGMLSPGNPLGAVEAAAFAIGLEKRISRESALEVLLNTARFADGIYGAEAATQTFFKKPARSLSPEEAAILAVYLHFPDETSIDNPDNLAIARRDRLIEKVANRSSSGSKPSGSTSSVTAPDNTTTATDEVAPDMNEDEESQSEPEAPPSGSDLPDAG
jgi:monofunctional biosynthetic peptidoglycan transglycosylase